MHDIGYSEFTGVNPEDLHAAATYYDRLVNNTLPHQQAEQIAAAFDTTLTPSELNTIMGMYACNLDLDLQKCVEIIIFKPSRRLQ
jgi:hypothetical protein